MLSFTFCKLLLFITHFIFFITWSIIISWNLPLSLLFKAQDLFLNTDWKELDGATSVKKVAENFQKLFTETKNNMNLDDTINTIKKAQQCSSIKSFVQETVEKMAGLLQFISKRICSQVLEISKDFLSRLV